MVLQALGGPCAPGRRGFLRPDLGPERRACVPVDFRRGWGWGHGSPIRRASFRAELQGVYDTLCLWGLSSDPTSWL